MSASNSCPVIVLAGGLGTRLRSVVSDRPKILAPVDETPFISILLNWLQQQGFTQIIFSLGYLAEQVEQYIADYRGELLLSSVKESTPLGTLGGLATVLRKTQSLNVDEVVVINGDTFVDMALADFVQDARQLCSSDSSQCLSVLAVKEVTDVSRYGAVTLNALVETPDHIRQVTRFNEKQPCAEKAMPGWINAGIYYFSAQAIKQLCLYESGSLEHEFLTPEADEQRLGAITIPVTAKFIDIGTPASLAAASDILEPYL